MRARRGLPRYLTCLCTASSKVWHSMKHKQEEHNANNERFRMCVGYVTKSGTPEVPRELNEKSVELAEGGG